MRKNNIDLNDFEYRCALSSEVAEISNIVIKDRIKVRRVLRFWFVFAGLLLVSSLIGIAEEWGRLPFTELCVLCVICIPFFIILKYLIRVERVIKSVKGGCFDVADAVVLEKPKLLNTVAICYSHLWDLKGSRTDETYSYLRDYNNVFDDKGSIGIRIVRVVIKERTKDWVYNLIIPEYMKG